MTAHAGHGEVALIQIGDDTILFASGTGETDLIDIEVWLTGVTAATLTASDFF